MRRGWLIWGVGALFYVYDFLIRVSPGLMVDEMMRDFAVDAASLGALSAWYLYGYAVLQIPIGLVLDRWGARRLLPAAALVTAAGALLMAIAPDLAVARFGRLLNGIGGAPAFLGSLALAARFLPLEHFAVLSGLTMALGTLGAMLLGLPLASAVQTFGREPASLALAAAGLLVVLLLWRSLRGQPDPASASRSIGGTLRQAARDPRIWMLAFVNCTFSGPMLAFGALWGVPFLTTSYGITRGTAVEINALLLIAWGLGGPLFGWISDRTGSRRRPLIAALALAAALWLALALVPLPLWLLALLYLALGLATGGIMLGFAFARDIAGEAGVTAGGILNTVMTLAGAVLQPLFGWLLDQQWAGTTVQGARLYPVAAYGHAALLFVALQVTALIIAMRLKDAARPAS